MYKKQSKNSYLIYILHMTPLLFLFNLSQSTTENITIENNETGLQ